MPEPDVHPRTDDAVRPKPSGRALQLESSAHNVETAVTASLKKQLAENESLSLRCQSAEEDLEAHKLAWKSDGARMADRLSLLERALEAAAADAATVRRVLSNQRNRWRRATAVAGLVALLSLCVVYWRNTPATGKVTPPPPIAARQAKPRPAIDLPIDPRFSLTSALDRLDDALSAAPGISPEEALRKVSGNKQGCMMVWSNDLPSVLFGGDPLPKTLAECAQAVSNLR